MNNLDPQTTSIPSWQPLSELGAAPLEQRIRELIGVAGSLTHTLRQKCAGNFRLRLLTEGQANPGGDRIREVLMLCNDTPWVFAQTLIPVAAAERFQWLNELGDQPLGDTLFRQPDVQRKDLEFGQLPAGSPLFERVAAAVSPTPVPAQLWARRSAIQISEHELSVNEVFLPDASRC